MTSGPSTIARPACRYLGTTHDATVHCGYATRENVCYAAARRQSINLEFQETYCLGGPYEECARFQEAQGAVASTASQPAEVIAPVSDPPSGGVAWRPLLLGAAGVIAIAFLAFLLLRPAAAPASPSTPTTVPTAAPITPTDAPLAALDLTNTPAPTNTIMPASTATTRPTTAAATSTSTSTPTTAPTATATAGATAAATITPTVVITGPYLITADIVNVREGPGVTYRALGVLQNGERWPVQGRNAAGDWVQGCCLAGLPGWITTQFVTVSVPIGDLPIIEVVVPVTPTVGITVTATITP